MRTKEEYNAYMAKYMLDRYHRRRAKAIAAMGGACVKCRSQEDLEFDHEDRAAKGFCIAKAFAGFSEKRLAEELKKCRLLCQKCHALKTILERGFTPAKGRHGTISSGRYCKCERCASAKREYMRDWRKKQQLLGSTPR